MNLRRILGAVALACVGFAAPAHAQFVPGATIWRDYVVDGVSSSGPWSPRKSDIRTWSTTMETNIGLTAGILKTAIATSTFPSVFQSIVLSGYSAANDGGQGCVWIKTVSTAYSAIQSADGAWWAPSNQGAFNAACAGALGFDVSPSDKYANLITAFNLATNTGAVGGTGGSVHVNPRNGMVVGASTSSTEQLAMPASQTLSGCEAGRFHLDYLPLLAQSALIASGSATKVECLYLTNNANVGTASTLATGISVGQGTDPWADFNGVLRDLSIYGFNTSITINGASFWQGHNLFLQNFGKYGMTIDNQGAYALHCDSGDWAINGLTASSDNTLTYTSTANIFWKCGGGGKVINMKLLGGAKGWWNQTLPAASGGNTQDLLISNSSIENQSAYGIHFDNSNDGEFRFPLLTALQFDAMPYGIVMNGGSFSGPVAGKYPYTTRHGFFGSLIFSHIPGAAISLANGNDNIVIGLNNCVSDDPVLQVASCYEDLRNNYYEDGYWDRRMKHSLRAVPVTNSGDPANPYTSLYKIYVPVGRAAKVRLVFEGTQVSTGWFYRSEEFTLGNAADTVLTYDNDNSNQKGVGAITFAVDTPTVASSAYALVKVKAPANTINATVTIDGDGKFTKVVKQW